MTLRFAEKILLTGYVIMLYPLKLNWWVGEGHNA